MDRPTQETAGIKALSAEKITELMTSLDQPEFRGRQIVQWLYGKGVRSYDEMTSLPKPLRDELEENYPLYFPKVLKREISADGTRKYLVELGDGTKIETVGLPNNHRLTVCFSTQAGCAMGCTFCYTGKNGLVRSLAPGEMVDQVRIVAEDFGERPTNAVAMGQGEPFNNYDNVLAALRFMNSPDGLEIGARHLTVSTCGILPQIRRFATEPEQFTLAVSLHSANQLTRNRLMPGVRAYTLDRLRDSLVSYSESTGRRPTFEYSLIAGQNDTDEELAALVEFCTDMLCHVNLIQINPVPGTGYKPSTQERAEEFARALGRVGVEVSLRTPRGTDVSGACGQLTQHTGNQSSSSSTPDKTSLPADKPAPDKTTASDDAAANSHAASKPSMASKSSSSSRRPQGASSGRSTSGYSKSSSSSGRSASGYSKSSASSGRSTSGYSKSSSSSDRSSSHVPSSSQSRTDAPSRSYNKPYNRDHSDNGSADGASGHSYNKPYNRDRSADRSSDRPYSKPYDRDRSGNGSADGTSERSYNKPYDRNRSDNASSERPYHKPYDRDRSNGRPDGSASSRSYSKPYDRDRSSDNSSDRPSNRPYSKPYGQDSARPADRRPADRTYGSRNSNQSASGRTSTNRPSSYRPQTNRPGNAHRPNGNAGRNGRSGQ